MWNGNEEEVILDSNSDSDGRGQGLALGVGAGKKGLSWDRQALACPLPQPGWHSAPGVSTHRELACCGVFSSGRHSPGDVGAPCGLCGRAVGSVCSDWGAPALETGQSALPGPNPGPGPACHVTAWARGMVSAAISTALGAGWTAAPVTGAHREVFLQPVPSQTLLLRDECCLGDGGLAGPSQWTGAQAAGLGTAHSADGRPVGCPAGTCGCLPIAGGPGHRGLGLR